MFEKGDLILYGATGVCRIADIAPRAGGEEDQLYYTIRPLRQECVIYAPVESDKVYMRPILTREEAEQLIDTIPHTDARPFQSRVVRELSDHYGAAIRSHDCAQLLKLTMSIWKKRENARHGKVVFYEPSFGKELKLSMLDTYGVQTEDLGFRAQGPNYKAFYEAAIDDIRKCVKQAQEEIYHG